MYIHIWFIQIISNSMSLSLFNQGYKVYYTTNSNQPEASWNSQMIDNSELTTVSELTPHAIYTVRVQAYTSMGAGPMSTPVQVKTQQGEWQLYTPFGPLQPPTENWLPNQFQLVNPHKHLYTRRHTDTHSQLNFEYEIGKGSKHVQFNWSEITAIS